MMVVDERGVFRDDNFQKAVAALNDAAGDGGGKRGGKGGAGGGDKGVAGPQGVNAGEKSDIFKIVKMIMERNYDPVRGTCACCALLCIPDAMCMACTSVRTSQGLCILLQVS